MITNKAMVDWLTLTTYEEKMFNGVRLEAGLVGVEGRYTKRLQYDGVVIDVVGGTAFCGEAKIKGRRHFMIQVSGEAADRIISEPGVAMYIAGYQELRCTRIDVQVTIEEPAGWSQVELWQECEKQGLRPTINRSPGLTGELVTVYTGGRGAGRLNRTYAKEDDSGTRYIRFETEFGRGYAQTVASSICRGRASREHFINGEVWRKRKVGMFALFDLGGDRQIPKQSNVVSCSSTERWMLNTVIPALVKYKNSHDRSDKVLRMLREALDDIDDSYGSV